MQTLNIHELHALRQAIFLNAKALFHESKLLLENSMYSRAYLLAHYCIEELGKIPIVVGTISKLSLGEQVDWKKVKKRFCSHISKIESQNAHFYTFGLEIDQLHDSDLEWLLEANSSIPESYQKKNISTYVDVIGGRTLSPNDEIGKVDAERVFKFAAACLRSHERSEQLTNPILYMNEPAGTSKN